MTELRFDDLRALTTDLAFRVMEKITATDWGKTEVCATFGLSSQSCSSYVYLEVVREDEDGDEEYDVVKVRFSDHAARHGSHVSIRINDRCRAVHVMYDDDGAQHECDEETRDSDYLCTAITAADFEALAAEGVTAITALVGP